MGNFRRCCLDFSKPVALVGFASSSRDQAPFNDPNVEVWTMNHAPISWIPRWDVLFEIHSLNHLKAVAGHQVEPSKYLEWLAAQPGPDKQGHKPIYMQHASSEFPASVGLPREELNKWFEERGGHVKGYFAPDYYTSTISWMMAMAIMQGRPEISLYGIDLLQDEEYFYQRAGAEYLVGFARGMGIRVFIPEQSAMCKANYTYGFSVEPEAGMFSPLVEYIEDKGKFCDAQVARAKQDAHTFSGALQMADLARKWIEGEELGEGKDALTMVKEKAAELERRFKQAESATIMLTGQAEMARTCVTWTKHYARGGTLNP